MKGVYRISNNDGKCFKKKEKKEKKEKKIVRLRWSEIEDMSYEELDIYLNNTFKINNH